MSAIYYHNPQCSKSRKCLEILKNKKIDFKVKEYLIEKLDHDEIKKILKLLGINALGLMRKKEAIFSELHLADKNLSEDEYIQCIQEHPILLERPILVTSSGAVIGRPVEKLEEFILTN